MCTGNTISSIYSITNTKFNTDSMNQSDSMTFGGQVGHAEPPETQSLRAVGAMPAVNSQRAVATLNARG